jgi:hypothetical protein
LEANEIRHRRRDANIVGQNVVNLRHQAGSTREARAAKLQLAGFPATRTIMANIETGRCSVGDKRLLHSHKSLVWRLAAFS